LGQTFMKGQTSNKRERLTAADIAGLKQQGAAVHEARARIRQLKWLKPIADDLDIGKSVGVSLLPNASKNEFKSALSVKAKGSDNILELSAGRTVQNEGLTDTNARRWVDHIRRFADEKGPTGIILVEGLDTLGIAQRGKGSEIIHDYLAEIATSYLVLPDANPVQPKIVGIGEVSPNDASMIRGGIAYQLIDSDPFTNSLVSHFAINQTGLISPLTLRLPARGSLAGGGYFTRQTRFDAPMNCAAEVHDQPVANLVGL
jgi:hypothetical protein